MQYMLKQADELAATMATLGLSRSGQATMAAVIADSLHRTRLLDSTVVVRVQLPCQVIARALGPLLAGRSAPNRRSVNA